MYFSAAVMSQRESEVYIKVKFDEFSHPRFNLYFVTSRQDLSSMKQFTLDKLYDVMPHPDSSPVNIIPVYYIHGHCGDYFQCRFWARSSFQHSGGPNSLSTLPGSETQEYLFFTFDLNGDFPALDGIAIKDQIEYIDAVLKRMANFFDSVLNYSPEIIVIGQSMGAFIARYLSFLRNDIMLTVLMSGLISRPFLCFQEDINALYLDTLDEHYKLARPKRGNGFTLSFVGGRNDWLAESFNSYMPVDGHKKWLTLWTAQVKGCWKEQSDHNSISNDLVLPSLVFSTLNRNFPGIVGFDEWVATLSSDKEFLSIHEDLQVPWDSWTPKKIFLMEQPSMFISLENRTASLYSVRNNIGGQGSEQFLLFVFGYTLGLDLFIYKGNDDPTALIALELNVQALPWTDSSSGRSTFITKIELRLPSESSLHFYFGSKPTDYRAPHLPAFVKYHGCEPFISMYSIKDLEHIKSVSMPMLNPEFIKWQLHGTAMKSFGFKSLLVHNAIFQLDKPCEKGDILVCETEGKEPSQSVSFIDASTFVYLALYEKFTPMRFYLLSPLDAAVGEDVSRRRSPTSIRFSIVQYIVALVRHDLFSVLFYGYWCITYAFFMYSLLWPVEKFVNQVSIYGLTFKALKASLVVNFLALVKCKASAVVIMSMLARTCFAFLAFLLVHVVSDFVSIVLYHLRGIMPVIGGGHLGLAALAASTFVCSEQAFTLLLFIVMHSLKTASQIKYLSLSLFIFQAPFLWARPRRIIEPNAPALAFFPLVVLMARKIMGLDVVLPYSMKLLLVLVFGAGGIVIYWTSHELRRSNILVKAYGASLIPIVLLLMLGTLKSQFLGEKEKNVLKDFKSIP